MSLRLHPHSHMVLYGEEVEGAARDVKIYYDKLYLLKQSYGQSWEQSQQ